MTNTVRVLSILTGYVMHLDCSQHTCVVTCTSVVFQQAVSVNSLMVFTFHTLTYVCVDEMFDLLPVSSFKLCRIVSRLEALTSITFHTLSLQLQLCCYLSPVI